MKQHPTTDFTTSTNTSPPTPSGSLLPAPVQQFSLENQPRHRRRRGFPSLHRRLKETTQEWTAGAWRRLLRQFEASPVPPTSDEDQPETEDEEEGVEGNELLGSWWGSTKRAQALAEADEIDEVVVDREWGDDLKSTNSSEQGQGEKTQRPVWTPATAAVGGGGQTQTDNASEHSSSFAATKVVSAVRWRVWPAVRTFFDPRFSEETSEERYRSENWYLRKPVAIWCAAFYILNWVVSVAFIPQPTLFCDKIFFWGVAPPFTFAIFFMILFDFPRRRRLVYQVTLTVSTWMWAVYLLLVMYLCGYYKKETARFDCGTKDFLAMFYYSSAPPVIALFGLNSDRFPALVGTVSFMALACSLIVPERHTWIRNVINFMCFHLFLLFLHYQRDSGERRLYILRDQLKVQFRATQKAQVAERHAANSKRRLTSYVFHEVRVPLNTALLAVQNIAASGHIDAAHDIEFTALEGSLGMMSKVLNDVLDFNRMDSGRFESVAKPYAFHQVMRSLFVPLRLATDARGLEFVTDLDRSIDTVTREALYEALGYDEEGVVQRMAGAGAGAEDDGLVVGDETRLRQIITNLASNACKFTPAGGKLVVKTRLILPTRLLPSRTDSETLTNSNTDYSKDTKDDESDGKGFVEGNVPRPSLSSTQLARHNTLLRKQTPLEWIVVRIEITDTGAGIRPRDIIENKLFSAFTQTELGKQQGGKGTGLGLALVRQIVKLSGGRLGIRSKPGYGSTFWVEMPFGVGAKAVPMLNTPEYNRSVTSTPRHDLDPYMPLALSDASHTTGRTRAPSARPGAQTNAMHSIMDQQGLVEISTKGNTDGRILTRMLGDTSTGTDPTPTVPLTTPESSPTITPPMPPLTTRASSNTTVRPNFVQLPSPALFPYDESLHERPSTDGSASAASQITWQIGLRVLVVDDDPLTRKLMARMLSRLGCKVSTAENGDIALELILNGHSSARPTPASERENYGSAGLSIEALAAAAAQATDEHKYSVVFLDNQMPVMSGLDAVARLREMGRKDFVVGVTGNALLDDQQEFYSAGVDHVLTKPVQEKNLRAMLALADERRKQRLLDAPDPPIPL
ncbi:hypothetical protein BDW22DRAFT_1455391 [Trametopsis cervina]|nr:hypothetical protein BDW22DRAFT_1455391 [Trametopsis cervina]